jgi:hypothetical protein
MIQAKCAFCRPGGTIQAKQVLIEGEHVYLCVPKGQMVEGYLIMTPFRCHDRGRPRGCLAQLSPEPFRELAWFRDIVARFYREHYAIEPGTYYEQGRAGGGALVDTMGRFPHHAHLCSLPISVNLHAVLEPAFTPLPIARLEDLPSVVSGEPYVYAECVDSTGVFRKYAYVGTTDRGRQQLERLRLKPIIGDLIGTSDRADWRAYPGDVEMERVIETFTAFWHQHGDRLTCGRQRYR